MKADSKSEFRQPKEIRRPNFATAVPPARSSLSGFRALIFGFLFACLGGGFVSCLCAGEPSTFSTTNAAASTRQFSESDLLELLTATLQQEYIKDKGELELRITRPWAACKIPDEPLTLVILDLPNIGVTPSFIARFELRTSDRSIGTWQTAVQARVWREIWVARAPIKRGQLVCDADVARERRDVIPLRDHTADFEAVDARFEFAEPVQKGAPVLARSIRLRAVIRRGQTADARLRDGNLNISMKVEALEDGAPGQIIRARNPVSRRDVSGEVLDGQTILISL